MNEHEEIKNNKSDEKEKTSANVAAIVCMVAIVGLLLLSCAIAEYKNVPVISMEKPIDNNRFEIEMTEKLPNTPNYVSVITDRNTDVQYLVVYGSSGIGVTTMRDTNGMVLLRE